MSINKLLKDFTRIKPQEEFNQSLRLKRFQTFSSYPVTRMLYLVLVIGLPIIFTDMLSDTIINHFTGITSTILDGVCHILTIVLIILAYRFYCRTIENREAKEFSFSFSLLELGIGIFLGGMIITLVTIILAHYGIYQINTLKHTNILIESVYIFFTGAFVAEVIFRLALFRLFEEKLGTWVSIVIIAMIFAVSHASNIHVTFSTTFFMFISDILFGAAFILTRRIWLVWGMHGAWNFMEDGVFGFPNSGIDQFPSLINPIIKGPVLLTGGSYGIDASILSVVLSIIGGAILLYFAIKSKQVVRKLRISLSKKIS